MTLTRLPAYLHISLFVLAGLTCLPAQTAKTKAELYTQVDSSLPSNATGAITAATLRTVVKDVVASGATDAQGAKADTALQSGAAISTISGLQTALDAKAASASLSAVALSGSYTDLTGKPSLFDGTWGSLSGKPSFATVATSGNYTDLTSRPSLATVATSGSYTDLTNKPTLFSGNYTDLTNKPSLFDGTWSSLSGKPTLATIATTGSASDLTGTLADARLSSNVPLLTGNNTFTGTLQTAPAWLLPTYAGKTISTSQNGLGWDNLGRVTLQTTVGALQFYSTGTPAIPVIYWPGKISCDSLIANTSNISVDAANITGNQINQGIVLNSLYAPLQQWSGTQAAAGAVGIPWNTAGMIGGYQPTVGIYYPQCEVISGSGVDNYPKGRYRNATQMKSDLAIAATDLTATGTKDATTYLRGDNTWATVSGGGSATPAPRLLTANATISSADGVIICTGSGGITLTLPAANAVSPRPIQLEILNRTSGTVTLATAGADLLEGQTTGLISAGASWSITSDATSNWYLY